MKTVSLISFFNVEDLLTRIILTRVDDKTEPSGYLFTDT